MVKEEPAEYQGIYRRFDALLTMRATPKSTTPRSASWRTPS